jgi:hypothetical protein
MKNKKVSMPAELVRRYPKAKWQNKAIGTEEQEYKLDRIHDINGEVIEFWKKI